MIYQSQAVMFNNQKEGQFLQHTTIYLHDGCSCMVFQMITVFPWSAKTVQEQGPNHLIGKLPNVAKY